MTLILTVSKMMGCESIKVKSIVTDYSVKEVCDYLKKCPNVHRHSPKYHNPLEHNFIYNDTKHIIEIQLSGYKTELDLYFQFSLCHPLSIDKKFIDFTKSIGNNLNLKIEIMESYQGEKCIFCPPEYTGYAEILQEAIKVKRGYWITDFGEETAVVTCSEAIMKYVLPKCK